MIDRRQFLRQFIPRGQSPESSSEPITRKGIEQSDRSISRRDFLVAMGVSAATVRTSEPNFKSPDNLPINLLVEGFLNDYFSDVLSPYLSSQELTAEIQAIGGEAGKFQPSQFSLSDGCPGFSSLVDQAKQTAIEHDPVRREELDKAVRSVVKDAFTALHTNGYINILRGDEELVSLVVEKLRSGDLPHIPNSQNILELGLQIISCLKQEFESDNRSREKFMIINLQKNISEDGRYEIKDWVWHSALQNRGSTPFTELEDGSAGFVEPMGIEDGDPTVVLGAIAGRGSGNTPPPKPPYMSWEEYYRRYGKEVFKTSQASRNGTSRRGFLQRLVAGLGLVGLVGATAARYVPPVRDLVMEKAIIKYFFKADQERIEREMQESRVPKLFEEIANYERRMDQDRNYTVTDRDGNEMGKIRNNYVSYEQLASIPFLIDAMLVREDETFWDHNGVEGNGVARAAMGRGGGSTITMQLVKNMCWDFEEYYALDESGDEQSVKFRSNKAMQMQLAWLLEKRIFDKLKQDDPGMDDKAVKRKMKEKVLEMYFNTVDFGPGIRGISAGANFLFGTRILENGYVTDPQVLCLATMPNRPSNLDSEYIKNQSRNLLDRMFERGLIPGLQVKENILYDLENNTGFSLGSSPKDGFIQYLEYLLRKNPNHRLDRNEEWGVLPREMDIMIETTIDSKLNQIIAGELGTYVPRLLQAGFKADGMKISVLVRDSESGEILGTAGDLMGQVSPASLVKPFLYADLLQRRVEGRDKGQDEAIISKIVEFWNTPVDARSPVGVDIIGNKGVGDDTVAQWDVQNAYGAEGDANLEVSHSLARSMNTSLVRFLLDNGYSRIDIQRVLEKYGIVSDMAAEDLHYPMMLGSVPSNVLRLATAYSALLNHGEMIGNKAITKSKFLHSVDGQERLIVQDLVPPVPTHTLDSRVSDSMTWGIQQDSDVFYGVLGNDSNLDGEFGSMYGTLNRHDNVSNTIVGGLNSLDGVPFAWKSGTNQAVTYTVVDPTSGQEVLKAKNSALICGGALPAKSEYLGKKPELIVYVECDDLPQIEGGYYKEISSLDLIPLWRGIMDRISLEYTKVE